MSGTAVSGSAYYLALIGGALMILLGLLGVLVRFGAFIFSWGFAYSGVVTLVMGIIAIIGARKVNTLAWAIALIIVGLIGGGVGGLLVLVGAIIGLVDVTITKA